MREPIQTHEIPYIVTEEVHRKRAQWHKDVSDMFEQEYIKRRLKENGIDIGELEKERE